MAVRGILGIPFRRAAPRVRSIKVRTTLFTIAIFVFGLWALAFYVSNMLRADMERQLSQSQFSAVSFMATRVNNELEHQVTALNQIAGVIDEASPSHPEARIKFIENRPVLLSLFDGGVFVTDSAGTAIADALAVPGRIGTNYIDRESIFVPLAEGRAVVGRPPMGKALRAPIFSSTAPIRDRQGRAVRIAGFIQDITDRRRMEERVRQMA